MLAILTTHAIQYQVPIWKALAARGGPFKVLYMSDQGLKERFNAVGRTLAWISTCSADIGARMGSRPQGHASGDVLEPPPQTRFCRDAAQDGRARALGAGLAGLLPIGR